ncbi:MAG: 50S ribosomal protein L24e [DPANN group archaeon]|nr:50S ribosomal protein L24e [DPANN group archaeon]
MMVKCSFSGENIPPGTGKMYIKKDGKVLYFKDSKSQKNYLKLGRKPRNTKWTKEAHRVKEGTIQSQKQAGKAPGAKNPTKTR